MMAIHTTRWRGMLEAMAPASPEGARAAAHLDNPRFLEPFVDTMLVPFRAGWRIVSELPCLEIFADRDGGLMVAFSLFDAARTGTALSVAHLARECRISRSHVMEMLRAAAEAGLVRRDSGRSSEGGVLAEPALVEAMQMLMATALARLTAPPARAWRRSVPRRYRTRREPVATPPGGPRRRGVGCQGFSASRLGKVVGDAKRRHHHRRFLADQGHEAVGIRLSRPKVA